MRITPEMLLDALKTADDGLSWYRIEDTGITGIDGWFDLAKAAELLTAKLLANESERMIDEAAWNAGD